jgi:hypothetical protein
MRMGPDVRPGLQEPAAICRFLRLRKATRRLSPADGAVRCVRPNRLVDDDAFLGARDGARTAHGRVTVSIGTARAYLEADPLRSRLAVRSAKLSSDPPSGAIACGTRRGWPIAEAGF